MITTPEIICDLFSFLDKDQIERVQLVNQLWNSVIIRHKNILPLRQFMYLKFYRNEIHLYAREDPKEDLSKSLVFIYRIKFDGTNLSKFEEDVSPRYLQLTVDEVLTNLNDVVFDHIQIKYCGFEDRLNNFLNMMKLVTTKTGGRFLGRYGKCFDERFGSKKLVEIFDNYIIVDELTFDYSHGLGSYIREVCANSEIVQLPSTPKEIRLFYLEFQENEEVLYFTCNGKLDGANRLTINFDIVNRSAPNYGNFIRQWFELYRTHENPISLVGKFEIYTCDNSVLDAVKTFVNKSQFCVKYSLETKELHSSSYGIINQYLKRSCVLHETDSYALVIEMEYDVETDMSSINASDLDQPPCDKMKLISFIVKSL